MKKDIRNYDKNGKWHGLQITYYHNGNICEIVNYHHGNKHGYRAWFYKNKSIYFKQYRDMGKWIYNEDHWDNKQIQIKI